MTQTDPGVLWLSVNYVGDPDDQVGKLHIDHADPVVLMGTELMDRIIAEEHHPDVEAKGDLITIRASNRTVVYRIGEYDPQRRNYLLTWPD